MGASLKVATCHKPTFGARSFDHLGRVPLGEGGTSEAGGAGDELCGHAMAIERPLPLGCANDVAFSQSRGGTVPKPHFFNGASAAISTGWPPPMPWWRGCCCNLSKLNDREESHA